MSMSIETSAGPRGKLRAELLGLLQGVVHDELAAADLADDQPIAAQIALDSMDFLDFVIEIRKKLRVEIPEEKYAELVSIQALLDYILVQQTILAQQANTHWELTSA
jgi:acyl carrier protein